MTRLIGLAVLLLAAASSAEELFMPMVAQRQGQNGAWWNTEVWITNTTATTGSWAAIFLPAGQSNVEGLREEPVPLDLPPGASVHRSDLIPQGAVGTLRFVVTPGVVVFGRVFNSAGRGSFGEGMQAMPRAAAARPGEVVHLVGLRRTPAFRTNVAFFNPAEETGAVRLRLLSQRGEVLGEESYRIVGGGYVQLDDALHALGVSRSDNARAEISGTVPFFAYASVVDARSGAPTLVPPLR